jgi:toxin FitB
VLHFRFELATLLNQFRSRDQIVYLESENLVRAAELWAWCRKKGLATTENKGVDIDVILISQAESQKQFFEEVIILTIDVGDLSIFCDWGIKIWDWSSALEDCDNGVINLL